jgi:hypothetical protein
MIKCLFLNLDHSIKQSLDSTRNVQSNDQKAISPSPSQYHIDLPINSNVDTSQPSSSSSSSTHVFQNEDNHTSIDIDHIQLSDLSNSCKY